MAPSTKKIVPPEVLYTFFDNPLVSSRNRLNVTSAYDSFGSWDGLSVDPRPFVKLDERNTVSTGRRPAGCSGKRVIGLHNPPIGGVFEIRNSTFGSIPMTIEQELANAYITENEEEKATLDEPFLSTHGIVFPDIKSTKKPLKCENVSDYLMPPKMRREINEFEVKSYRAQKILQKAEHQKLRLHHLLKHHYPNGALQVDSAANPGTEVYKEDAERRLKADIYDRVHCQRRSENLDRLIGAPEKRFGYNPFLYNPGLTSQFMYAEIKLMQSKGRSTALESSPSRTHDRLFYSKPPKINLKRRQELVNEMHGGKLYNIISGNSLPDSLKPSVTERECKWLGHPSQISLERGRNMQGAITIS